MTKRINCAAGVDFCLVPLYKLALKYEAHFKTLQYELWAGAAQGGAGARGCSCRDVPAPVEAGRTAVWVLGRVCNFCSGSEAQFWLYTYISDKGKFQQYYLPVSLWCTFNIFLLPLACLALTVMGGLKAVKAGEFLLAGVRIILAEK